MVFYAWGGKGILQEESNGPKPLVILKGPLGSERLTKVFRVTWSHYACTSIFVFVLPRDFESGAKQNTFLKLQPISYAASLKPTIDVISEVL